MVRSACFYLLSKGHVVPYSWKFSPGNTNFDYLSKGEILPFNCRKIYSVAFRVRDQDSTCVQLSELAMYLLRYLQVVPPRGEWPDLAGPLSLSLSPSVIEGANSAISSARYVIERLTLMKTAKRLKRVPYNM